MPRALKLDKDGSLKLLEADVTKQIKDYLLTKQWELIRTAADKVITAAGHWSRPFKKYHPDWVCVRPIRTIGQTEFFYLELKARRAATDKKRAEGQTAFARDAMAKGFACYRMPNGLEDPYEHFKAWYQAMYEGQNEDNACIRRDSIESTDQIQEA